MEQKFTEVKAKEQILREQLVSHLDALRAEKTKVTETTELTICMIHWPTIFIDIYMYLISVTHSPFN